MKPQKVVAALLLIAATAWAQDWAGLNGIAPGAEVRVSLVGGRTVRGTFQQATPDSVVVTAARSQETFARADVRRVQLKKPGRRGRNALIGLGIGAASGLVSGGVIDAKTSDDWFPNGGKVILAPVGAILGTVIGVAIPTGGWRDVYRVR